MKKLQSSRKHFPKIITLATLVFTVGLFGFLATSPKAQGAPSDYALVWSDEFNGDALDMNAWDYQSGGWGDSIQSCYKYGTNNVGVNGGTLKITAKYEPGTACTGGKDFTSGFIQTKGKKFWKYGYFEARVKMPTNNGSTWPAFWLSPNEAVYGSWPKSGEIDVFEGKGYDPTYIAGNAHWSKDGRRKQIPKVFRVDSVGNWHTYAVKWQEDKLEFFVDGQHYHTINKFYKGVEDGHPWPFNIPFYIRLNVAIGGSYLEAPHNNAHNNASKFPATMEVDYVRVYQKTTPAPTNPTQPANPGGSSSSQNQQNSQTSNSTTKNNTSTGNKTSNGSSSSSAKKNNSSSNSNSSSSNSSDDKKVNSDGSSSNSSDESDSTAAYLDSSSDDSNGTTKSAATKSSTGVWKYVPAAIATTLLAAAAGTGIFFFIKKR